jgi:CTP:phosphocholine cytidylyltransferase-like protein
MHLSSKVYFGMKMILNIYIFINNEYKHNQIVSLYLWFRHSTMSHLCHNQNRLQKNIFMENLLCHFWYALACKYPLDH